MKSVKLYMGEKPKGGSLVLCRPNHDYYVLGDNYRLIDYKDEISLPLTLVHKSSFRLSEMDNLKSYLLSDVHAELKIEMLLSLGYSNDTEMCFLVFSAYAYSVRTFGVNPDFSTLRIEQKHNPEIDG